MYSYELIVASDSYKRLSSALVNNKIKTMSFFVGFVGVNGIKYTTMDTANLEEGQTKSIRLNH